MIKELTSEQKNFSLFVFLHQMLSVKICFISLGN